MIVLIALVLAASVASGAPESQTLDPVPPLSYGDRGEDVEALNEALAAAGFHPDEGERFGRRTRHAVYAFQKHHDLAVTGTFTDLMWDLLDRPIELPRQAQADRVEIDLGRQVLYVVEDHEVVLVVPISSGSGERYIGSNGRRQVATTPEGVFRFQRRIRGVRRAPLGTLYHPYYFKGGIAVHGSLEVPNQPASHGCVRVTLWDMEQLMEHFEIGQTVYVYGIRRPRPPAREPLPHPFA